MSDVEETLRQRGSVYGSIQIEAEISQAFKAIMYRTPSWRYLSAAQKHCLEMDAVKTARILNGDPNYRDNWHDKAGYAKLGEEACKKKEDIDA